jgi:hypothetical protein
MTGLGLLTAAVTSLGLLGVMVGCELVRYTHGTGSGMDPCRYRRVWWCRRHDHLGGTR